MAIQYFNYFTNVLHRNQEVAKLRYHPHLPLHLPYT